jgi:hypothetical protein
MAIAGPNRIQRGVGGKALKMRELAGLASTLSRELIFGF